MGTTRAPICSAQAGANREGLPHEERPLELSAGLSPIHKTALKAGTIVLIEAGDRHEIRNTGRSLLKTVSVYIPPAYRDEETELPAGRGAS
jgi:oxalate decarboxylase/phosphoglucose isomerase-like protein (cupin superfamily)